MDLTRYVNTFGYAMQQRYGEKVHKVSINAEFTCPNRDGTKGIGGCTFCNNSSFNPNAQQTPGVCEQVAAGKKVIRKRTGAQKYLAYFQAYTNTYAEISTLKALYDEALAIDKVIGLSIGTRPDCVPDKVLDLLADYRDQGHEIWLELGLQSTSDKVLQGVNRGHGFGEYVDAVARVQQRELQYCTHLIAGLPGEPVQATADSARRVTSMGTTGLKLHPLHIVRGTQMARQWKQGGVTPMTLDEYVQLVADIVTEAPSELIFHRLTGTANKDLLLAPDWTEYKWKVLNGIYLELQRRGKPQGSSFAFQAHASNNQIITTLPVLS
ncbi:TIGR01212 family radical SAM protein [Amphritea balenae]|uniref:TIGR01212 family radical SAM protein n=2 Tax=Amphritea balenae TaxID=452629 RepID=A0A3P1SZ33_9GAMM|nr:TIGR01212 family radical SAM protein [Amphritea balenae]